ncbi:MAG: tetratricopeptide repeat protein [Vulcanimicrobiota bacterium]
MFQDLIDENDLEWSENRLRVEILTLKRNENVEGLFRLYGVLAHVLARRGDYLKAQDALNDQEYLLVEHKWRGTDKEAWCLHDRALTFTELGRPGIAQGNLEKARELVPAEGGQELLSALDKAESILEKASS